MLEKYWKMMKNKTGELEIYIYDEIGCGSFWNDTYSAKDFLEDIDSQKDFKKIKLYINSPGGDVFEGVAIYNILQRLKTEKNVQVEVQVDGMAASIASIIAMAGDKILMPANSMMMIHNPWTYTRGNSIELRKRADELDKICENMKAIYMKRFNSIEEELSRLLDEETWFDANEAFELGFCDKILDEVKMVAKFDEKAFRNYKHVPDAFFNAQNNNPVEMDSETKALIERINKTLKYEEEFSYEQI